MRSPFPGMDPYIEGSGRWEGFHAKLISGIEGALEAALPSRYYVELGVRFYIVLAGVNEKESSPFLPDVGIVDSRKGPSRPDAPEQQAPEETGGVEVAVMQPFVDLHFQERFIEIYEKDEETRLVTCIELLSPSNKRKGTEGHDVYLRKRNSLMLGVVNFVEIDLLRGGERMPMIGHWPDGPYYTLVRRSMERNCRVHAGHYRRPLPGAAVPLARPDPDITLDLQPLIDRVYSRLHYAERLDYAAAIKPPLGAEDEDWLQEQLRARQPA